MTRRRNSGTRQALVSQLNISYSAFYAPRKRLAGVVFIAALLRSRSTSLSRRSLTRKARLAKQVHRASSLLDLLSRARRDCVRDDRELRRQVALAEDLHVLARRADEARLLQQLRRHL